MGTSKTLRALTAVALGVLLFAAAGCVRVELPEADVDSVSERIETGSATEIEATLDLGAGELDVVGGDPDAFEGNFEFSQPAWRPEVEYEVADGTGELRVKTPDDLGFDFSLNRKSRYAWDLRLPTGLPLYLDVNIGAGQADLDLRGCDLWDLNVDLGAGDTSIDLSGEWAHDMTASINAGAGKLTLKVPADVGVRLVGYRDGIGTYSADGFAQDGDALVNDAWETSEVRLDIELRRGIGEVVVKTVE